MQKLQQKECDILSQQTKSQINGKSKVSRCGCDIDSLNPSVHPTLGKHLITGYLQTTVNHKYPQSQCISIAWIKKNRGKIFRQLFSFNY